MSESSTTPTRTVYVSHDQVSAARALVRMLGGLDKVEPLIAKIATAQRPTGAHSLLAPGLAGAEAS